MRAISHIERRDEEGGVEEVQANQRETSDQSPSLLLCSPAVDDFATIDYVGHAAQALFLVRGLVLVRHVTKSKHLCHL